MVSITLPVEYRYVLLTATSTFALAIWHGIRVSPFRKAAKIPYPQDRCSASEIAAASSPDQAKDMYIFNCAQRAHYNFIEGYISALPAMLIAGVKYPVPAATVGAVWVVARVLYAIGYTRRDQEKGKGRLVGSILGFLTQFTLVGMAGFASWNMLA